MKYKVKRFSQCNISELTREERVYVSFPGSKRLKSKLSKIINDSYNRSNIAAHKSKQVFDKGLGIKNRALGKGLIKEARSRGSRVMDVGADYPSLIKSSSIDKSVIESASKAGEVRKARKISNATSKHDYLVHQVPGDGVENIAHELGHLDNMNSRNPIRRIISRLDRSDKINKINSTDPTNKKGLRSAIESFIASKIRLAEENNANKSALKIMKKHGASMDELNKAKNLFNTNLETYKKLENNYRIPIKNMLD